MQKSQCGIKFVDKFLNEIFDSSTNRLTREQTASLIDGNLFIYFLHDSQFFFQIKIIVASNMNVRFSNEVDDTNDGVITNYQILFILLIERD